MKMAELERMLMDDLAVDKGNLFTASLETPMLHAKWMKFSTEQVYKLKMLHQRMAKLKHVKWEFYALKYPNAKIYDKYSFDLKLTKSEIGMYIDADDDIQRQERINLKQEILVDRLTEAVKAIQFRHLNIKNAIEWHRLQFGETVK